MNSKHFIAYRFDIWLFYHMDTLAKGNNTYIRIKLNHGCKMDECKENKAFIFFRDIE